MLSYQNNKLSSCVRMYTTLIYLVVNFIKIIHYFILCYEKSSIFFPDNKLLGVPYGLYGMISLSTHCLIHFTGLLFL